MLRDTCYVPRVVDVCGKEACCGCQELEGVQRAVIVSGLRQFLSFLTYNHRKVSL